MTSTNTAASATAQSRIPSQEDVLAFQAPYLIEKLLKECVAETSEEAEALFMEVKRFIYLIRSEEATAYDMHSLRVDAAWHQFVLFTNEYVDFCLRFFGIYIHHAPSNAPALVSPAEHVEKKAPSTFADFQRRYFELFGEALPDVWYDYKHVSPNCRIVNYDGGRMSVREGDEWVDLLGAEGQVVLSVNELATPALHFVANTKAFFVRELPGGLDDSEKVALITALVECKALRVSP